MTGIEISKALREGRRVYGTLIVSTSPKWVEPVKRLGLDFVFIDTEHIAIDREKLSWMCHAYREAGLAPIVRIPSPDPFAATMAVEGGAVGVMAPYVESAAHVRSLVGAVKYRPLKGARLQAVLDGKERFTDELGDYLSRCNSGQLVLANIESRPAMEALDEILSVEELDAVVVGPHDLSCSMNLPERYMEAEFVDAVEEIIDKARAQGKGAGIHMVYREGIDQEIHFARRGANLILHRADIMMFRDALHDDLIHIKRELGDVDKSTSHRGINI